MLKSLQSKLFVHKLILKNLQSKLLTLLVLSTVLPVSAVGLYGLLSSSRALSDLSVNQIEKDVSTQSLRIEQLLAGVYGDILMLSQLPSMQGLIRARGAAEPAVGNLAYGGSLTEAESMQQVNTMFRAMMAARSHYRTLRYLDETGKELIRLDADSGIVQTRPPSALRSQAQATFFKKTQVLKSGQVYVSDIELEPSITQAQSSDPVIHYATPIYDPQGHFRGVLSATVLTYSLTDALQLVNESTQQKAMLITHDGHYLLHPDATKIWRSARQSSYTLQQDYPSEITNEILNGGRGSIYQELSKILSYDTINVGGSNRMIVLYDQPKYVVFQSISQFKRLSAGVIALSLGTVLVIGISIVRKLSRTQTKLYEEAKNAAITAESKAQQLEQALNELHKTQTQLVQTEKMSSLGQLVAGVAHEINNPVNFIYGNLAYVDEYTRDILKLMRSYQQHYPVPASTIQEQAEEIDIDFLMEDMPKMLASMKVGADRIRQIVLSLRNFSRLDEAEMKAVNIHDGLDSTLLILQNRLKARGHFPGIEVVKAYDNLPAVECYAGQLNQVFMNILSNGIDALEDALKAHAEPVERPEPAQALKFEAASANTATLSRQRPVPPTITIRTQKLNAHWVQIIIADNGPGIPAPVRDRLFEPFFTTKPIGKGTGLGLSISYQIITEKHGGNLSCVSEPGAGTEFRIEIPVRQTATHPTAEPTPPLPVTAA